MAGSLSQQLQSLIKESFSQDKSFLRRLKKGKLTREENPRSHFCVYFPAFDALGKQILLGHHKKSGLWLVNGGHIEKGELLEDALKREMKEEWGRAMPFSKPLRPNLLTLTKIISNPAGRPCRFHYDLWCFINVDKAKFKPDAKLLAEEFFKTKWFAFAAARSLVTDPNTLKAVEFLEKQFFNEEIY